MKVADSLKFLDAQWEKLSLQRSVHIAVAALRNNADVLFVGNEHAIHLEELLTRAGYGVEVNIHPSLETRRQWFREQVAKDQVLGRKFNRFAAFIKRKALA